MLGGNVGYPFPVHTYRYAPVVEEQVYVLLFEDHIQFFQSS